ncbi:hypothetical protein D7319_09275 [Streptomyces radicis]|uniref:Uncharacterized protein n=1 Tax=Streptomyces radicis TaxID=1750517 RepID=A0A3A9WD55_9ACTN|nr:hypothetical protein D7319_09275 [Streptomyces radicis]RKN24862.1 hypothetical protein D7318_10455 [Streptomyces radicis]
MCIAGERHRRGQRGGHQGAGAAVAEPLRGAFHQLVERCRGPRPGRPGVARPAHQDRLVALQALTQLTGGTQCLQRIGLLGERGEVDIAHGVNLG